MVRDALICRKGRYGWRWCVVPAALIDAFREHGWIVVLSSDEMHDIWTDAIEDVRQADEHKPLNRMRFVNRPCNGE
jgi:hypothetical protein